MNGVHRCKDYEMKINIALIYVIVIIDIIDIIIAVIMYIICVDTRPQVRREHQTGSGRQVISTDPDFQIVQSETQTKT